MTKPGLTGSQVFAVKIDHTRPSHPRVGTSSADVVYVEPVEAGLTRLLAVFSSTLPEKVGPVRSTRESDVDLLANYGTKVAFAFSGASDYTMARINKGTQVNLSFDADRTGYTREAGRPKPYDVIGTTSVLLQRAGGSVPPGDVGFYYGTAPTGGASGTAVRTSWTSSTISFSYASSAGKYLITSDGRQEVDVLTGGKPVEAANVIVQYVVTKPSGNRDINGVVTPLVEVIGTGKAILLREGKSWQGTWTRADAASPTAFKTADGQDMQLAKGSTWVLLVPQGQGVTVS